MSIFDVRSGKYRYVHSQFHEKMPFYIDMIGQDRCKENYYLKREHSPICVIGFCLQGRGILTQDGHTVQVKAGDLFILNLGGDHEYRPAGEWEFCWVNIAGEYYQQLLARYELDRNIVYPNCRLGQEFHQLVGYASDDATAIDDVQYEVQNFLMKLVLHLYQTKYLHQEDDLAVRIRAEFEKHSHSGLTQSEICKAIGITPRHAQRVFKQAYGISLHEFITGQKMMLAKALLSNTNSSIRQIAEDVGFSNEKYFSTFFLRNAGISPGQYRRQYGYQKHSI